MQVPRAVATRSVGEKDSPLPLLSVGASVAIFGVGRTVNRVAMEIAGVFDADIDHAAI